MWIRTKAGRLLNLTRCTELRTEPGTNGTVQIIAVDSLDGDHTAEVIADELTEESAERLMWELSARALRAAEINDQEIKLRS